jgi:RNA polymerase sigma factor (sigma-70 family)
MGEAMSDYRVKISVSNARIRRAIENAGFASVNAVCVHGGLRATAVGNIINMKMSPLAKDGSWRKVVIDLADVLGVLPDDLFSESQKTVTVKENSGHRDVQESELIKIAAQYMNSERLEDLRDNAAIDEIAHEESEKIIAAAVSDLPTRQAEVLNMRFGLNGCDPHSLVDIGDLIGVSPARVGQIETAALRNLRNKTGESLFNLLDQELT